MWLAERYQRFLARNDAYGTVVLDSRMEDQDARLRRFFERLQRDGTPYVSLGRIVDSLLLGPSHHSIGLQAADLIVDARWPRSARPAMRHAGTSSSCRVLRATPTPGWSRVLGSLLTRAVSAGKNRRRQSCSQTDAASRWLLLQPLLRHPQP